MVSWGYLISKVNEGIFTEKQSHLIVTSAIVALGAARQATSHVKATLGIGNDVKVITAMADVVQKIAAWAAKPIQIPDIDGCVEQVHGQYPGHRE
jgi:hypothetical protein